MPYTAAAKNLMLNALGAAVETVSLHTADPGSNGANEVSGGSPAYARKAITWGAAASGAIDDATNGATFDVPAGVTVTHVGFWDGATFMASDAVTNEVFAAQGTYTLNDADLDLSL